MSPADRPPWDGVDLPQAARDRIARGRSEGPFTSLLTVGGSTGLESVGFAPVGDVMGSCVMNLGWNGLANCGYGYGQGQRDSYSYSTASVVTNRTGDYRSYGPYVRALEKGYTTAIGRMLTEAQEIGAHGVVGVRISVEHFDSGSREFRAIGTSVRGRIEPRAKIPSRPFSTQLSGAEVSRALLNGWVPVSIVMGISVGIRHDDAYTRSQLMSRANTEMIGYTDLVTTVRKEAREVFENRLSASGATRSYATAISLRTWPVEPNTGHRDHVAEATVIGGGLVSFAGRARSAASGRTLTVLPLRDSRRTP